MPENTARNSVGPHVGWSQWLSDPGRKKSRLVLQDVDCVATFSLQETNSSHAAHSRNWQGESHPKEGTHRLGKWHPKWNPKKKREKKQGKLGPATGGSAGHICFLSGQLSCQTFQVI